MIDEKDITVYTSRLSLPFYTNEMWRIFFSIYFCLANLNFSLLITQNEFPNHRQMRLQSMNNRSGTGNCSSQAINIDTARDQLDNDGEQQNRAFIGITSSWKQVIRKSDNEATDNHSSPLNAIQVIFNIPYQISNESILNQTVFLTDTTLIVSSTYICFNGSSFTINYSTNKPLPHHVCLYLLLNITFLREIFICRTIKTTASLHNQEIEENQTVGPSAIFILLLMCLICMLEIATKKRFVYRIRQHLFHNKPLVQTSSTSTVIDRINPVITNANHFILSPIEEEILAATDLTSMRPDQRFTNHTLMNMTELTKRLNASHKEDESYTF